MKKLALLLLCLTIVFSLAACGADKDSEPSAPDHNYISTVVAPTCNSVGYTEHVCQDCGKSYKDNEVSATGNHTFYDLYVMESTCVSRKVLRTCSVCNIVAVIDEEPIAEHDFLDRVCTVCGELGPSEGLEITLNSDEKSYSVSGMGTCTDTDIIIPSIYNNLPVTTIGAGAFAYCYSLTGITIPSSVTTIGFYAFFNCDSLTGITIPSSVTSIGDDTFEYCYSLTSITVGENNEYYKDINGNLYTKDGKTLIQYAIGKKDTSFVIPDGVTSIGDSAFSSCDNLASITIPSSVISIGDSAFSCCDSLTSITVGENNEYYKDINGNLYTKDGKTLIQYAIGKKDSSFIIPDGVTTIGDEAFAHCDSLTKITIPSSVTTIGDWAFISCDSLYVVYNYSNLSFEIGSSANGDVAYHAKILVNNGVTSYRDDGYEYTLTEDDFLFRCKNSKYELFAYCGTEETITLPNDINGNEYSIYPMRRVTNVVIPNSFTTIGEGAFFNCDSLTGITIPSSVTSIGEAAFYDCDRLTNITIPSSVTTIGSSAFYDCDSLTTVIFEENSKLTIIGDGAFKYCDSLTGITIPSSVTTIGDGAFEYCESLTTVIFEENSQLTIIGDGAFEDCKSLTSITIPSSVTTIGFCAFYNCDSLTSVIFEENSQLTTIGDLAFCFCYNLKTVYYTGTESDWNTITIGSSNSNLTNARRYYYSETAPTTEGNYWHYVDGEIVVW